MTEFQGGQEHDEELTFREIIEKDIGGALPALLKFDEKRNRLYDRLAEVVVEMSESQGLGESEVEYTGIGDAFKNLLKEIYMNNSDHDVGFEMVLNFIKCDSDERIGMMRGFLDDEDECLQVFEREHLEAILSSIVADCDTVDELIDGVTDLYETDLLSDVDVFRGHLIEAHHQKYHDGSGDEASSDEVQILEIKKTKGEHAADVVKIALGVSIALAVDRLIHRNK